MSDREFRHFSQACDLHTLSHRALVTELIPDWMKAGVSDLDRRIADAAYGETPEHILELVFQSLDLDCDDILLDLGAGAGGVLSFVLSRGISAYGVEQNRLLVEAGRRFLNRRGQDPGRLLWGDFLQLDWPPATMVFSTTSRFRPPTLTRTAERIGRCSGLRKVATLGQPLELGSGWERTHLSRHEFRWNPSEPAIREKLYCWFKKETVFESEA